MNITQQKILTVADKINVNRDSLRQICRILGEAHPYNVSYHLARLEKNGFIKIDKISGNIKRIKAGKLEKGHFVAVPIFGSANCGDAKMFADENFAGYVKISQKIIRSQDGLLAVRAVGNSMNKASIDSRIIEDGDYVIVSRNKTPQNRDYVLAIIDDCACIKKMIVSPDKKIISLISESTEKHPDIFIDESDKFLINGVVQCVIKKPKL